MDYLYHKVKTPLAEEMESLKPVFDDFLVARISTDALIHNLQLLRSKTPQAKVCAAVKANAYGHGVDIIARALDQAGVEMMAVSNFNEVQQLIDLNITADIFVLGSQLSIYRGEQKKQVARWIVENEIRITPMTVEDVNALADAAELLGKKAHVHLKLDTGMSRMGLRSEQLKSIVSRIEQFPLIQIEGIYTHLAAADTDNEDFTGQQLKLLEDFKSYLASRSVDDIYIHKANSAATLSRPSMEANMIRPGLALYGLYSGPNNIERPDLKPVMKVISRLTVVKSIPQNSTIGYGCTYRASKEMVIAIVPIGYGDGYDRKLSNKGKMKICGQYVPIVGRVSMDQTIVDVTGLVEQAIDVKVGMEVTIIDDDPQAENSVESLAKLLDTIPYETATRLGPRIKRVRAN